LIEGNFIGTDPSGAIALGNTAGGIHVGARSDSTLIGGSIPAARNLISGNGGSGVVEVDPILKTTRRDF
jgi:titin